MILKEFILFQIQRRSQQGVLVEESVLQLSSSKYVRIEKGIIMCVDSEQYRPRVTCTSDDETVVTTKRRLEAILDLRPNKRFSPGDDWATTYCSVGIVLIATAMSGSHVKTELAAMTGFHLEFPHAVVEIMDKYYLWQTEWYLDLCAVMTRQDTKIESIIDSLECALESMWSAVWSRDLALWLEVCRAKIIFGGSLQDYIDLELAEEFEL